MATREEPLGYHAAQQVERTAALLDLLRKYIDNNQPAGVILTAAQELNRTTWDLKNAIARDLTEREDNEEQDIK